MTAGDVFPLLPQGFVSKHARAELSAGNGARERHRNVVVLGADVARTNNFNERFKSKWNQKVHFNSDYIFITHCGRVQLRPMTLDADDKPDRFHYTRRSRLTTRAPDYSPLEHLR
ncbi:hypothetical protein EVAR_19369_1 [Eumeta japonica]|uniref:Uncharacterized protein n=1 Tax=Eumeta variegata TaxID=151549 RepID=A0A4C1TRE9_EUMVA|nr:hypothetical protein EVAR_19369_1 [Eumeta japonica]